MKLAMHQITTGSGHDLRDTFRAYAESGWRHFEVNLGEVAAYVAEHGNNQLANLIQEFGLQCIGATGISIRAFGGSEGQRENEDTLRRHAETMNALECTAIVCGGDVPPADGTPPFPPRAQNSTECELSHRDSTYRVMLEQFAAEVSRLADIAAEYDVKLALEVNWCGLAQSIRTMAELVGMVGKPNVGAVWDPAHFFSTPSRLNDLDLLEGQFVHAHMNDFRDCIIEVMDINGDRVIPGDGILPLREWSDKVESLGYNGWHSVELFSDDIWSLPIEEICRLVKHGCKEVWPDAQF